MEDNVGNDPLNRDENGEDKKPLRFELEKKDTRFSSDNQPTGEQKSRGWWKKRRGKKLLQSILNLDFDGTTVDPSTGEKQQNIVKKQAAIYFQIPEEFITVEMIMSFRQIGMAIQRGDTSAYNSVMDRAFGKPKEVPEIEEYVVPVINFEAPEVDAPPIATSEEEVDDQILNEENNEQSNVE